MAQKLGWRFEAHCYYKLQVIKLLYVSIKCSLEHFLSYFSARIPKLMINPSPKPAAITEKTIVSPVIAKAE